MSRASATLLNRAAGPKGVPAAARSCQGRDPNMFKLRSQRRTASPAAAVVMAEPLEGRRLFAAVVHFSDADADAREAGLDRGTWVISRSGSTAASLAVQYTVGGSATNGVDYQTLSGTLTIPAGNSSASLVVIPKDDAAVEGTETVSVTLEATSAYTLGSPATATAPILDN